VPVLAFPITGKVHGMSQTRLAKISAAWSQKGRSALSVLGLCCLSLVMPPSSSLSKVEGDTIVLGAAVSLSGKYAGSGRHTKNGYDLAVATINKQGGVKVAGKPYKLKIKYYDDASDAKLGAKFAERLIREDQIKFMLGPYSSALTKAIAPVVDKYKIPMIEANGASPTIFSQGYRYVFGVLSTSEQYLNSVVDIAADITKKKGKDPKNLTLGLVIEDDPFSLDVRSGVIERAKARLIKVVVDEKFPPNFDDSAAIFEKIKKLKPTILIVSGHSKGAIAASRHIKEMKIHIPMVGMTHCEAGKLIEEFAAATEGFLCATQWSETLKYKGSVFGSARKFSRAYRKTHKEYKNTPYQAAESVAAVVVWKDEKLRSAIAATNLRTFYGNIKFAPTGQNVAKPTVLRQIQKGKLRVVAPIEWASWPLIYPRQAPE
jgi:branched-chain amino acid transport system substrate-binding protein